MAEEFITDTEQTEDGLPVFNKQSTTTDDGLPILKKKTSPPVSKNTGNSFVNGGGLDPTSLTNTFNQTAPLAPITDPHTRAIANAHAVRQQRQAAPQTIAPQASNEPERSILDQVGQALYVPAIKQGFNDLVFKPGAGAVDFIDRTIDKAYQGVTGEQTPEWLRKKGIFHDVSNQIQKEYDTRDKPSNIVSETAEGVAGTLPLIASMYTGEGEASLAMKAPQFFGKLSKVLATTKGLSGYKDATDKGQGYAQSLATAGTEAVKGGIEGQFLDAQMLVGAALGKGVVGKLAEKGLLKGGKAAQAVLHALSVGTVFGGTSAGEDLLNGKDIDTRNAMKQFGMGLAFEAIPTAQGINAEIKDRGEARKINDNTLQSATLASSVSNLNGESALRNLMEIPTEQVEAIHNDVKDGHEDLYANSIEQGVKAYETKDLNEKRNYYANQLLLKAQGDIKLTSEMIKQHPEEFVDAITESELPDEQKQDLLNKVQILSPKEEIPAEPTAKQGTGYTETPKPTVTFKTSRGSTYVSKGDGTTIRDKAERSDVGHEGQKGIQEQSQKTYYITPEDANVLGEIQTTNENKRAIVELPDGTIGIKYLDGKDGGKVERRTVVKPETEPKVGLMPLELWKDGTQSHFGNKITEVNEQPIESAVPAAEVLSEPTQPKAVKESVTAVDKGSIEQPKVEPIADTTATKPQDTGSEATQEKSEPTVNQQNNPKWSEENYGEWEQHRVDLEKKIFKDSINEDVSIDENIKSIDKSFESEAKKIKEIIGDDKIADDYIKAIKSGSKKASKIRSELSDEKQGLLDNRVNEEDFQDNYEYKELIEYSNTSNISDNLLFGKIGNLLSSPRDIKKAINRVIVKNLIVEASDRGYSQKDIVSKAIQDMQNRGHRLEDVTTLIKDTLENFGKNPKQEKSVKEIESPKKQITKAIDQREITPEAEKASERPDVVNKAVKEVRKSLTDTESQRKAELRKKFSGALNDVTRIPTLLLDKEFREYAGLIFKEAAGDFKAFSKELIEGVGEKIKEHLPQLYKELEKEYATGEETASETKSNRAIKNESNEAIAKEAGIEIKDNRGSQRSESVVDKEAQELIDKGYDVHELIDKVLKDKHIASDTENAILAKFRDAKDIRLKEVNDKIETDGATLSPKAFDELADERQRTFNDLQDAVQAIKDVGSAQSRALGSRRFTTTLDYSLADLISRQRQANGGEKLSTEQQEYILKLHSDLEAKQKAFDKKVADFESGQTVKEAEAKLERIKNEIALEARRNKRTVKIEQIDKDIDDVFANIKKITREKRATLSSNPIPIEYLPEIAKLAKLYTKKGVTTLSGIADNIFNGLKDDIEGLTKEHVLEAISNIPETVKKDPLQAVKARLKSSIRKIDTKTQAGDFTRTKRKPITLDKEAIELRRELDRAKHDFDVQIEKRILENRTRFEKNKDRLVNILGLPRALKATLDFSAVLRQGLILTAGHPTHALTSLKNMFGQTFSELKYNNWLHDLKHEPLYDLMKESKLYIADKSDPKILAREEEFTSNLAERIPGFGRVVAGSERAYTAYLNSIRVSVFKQEASKLLERGYTFEENPEQFKSLAKVINVLAGRGDIPEALGGKQPALLSMGLFSPRFMASRIHTLYIVGDVRLTREARLLAAKDIAATIGTVTTLLTLASLAGYSVQLNPLSSDFLKIKDGDTRFDITGGLASYITFLARMATGKTKSTSTGDITGGDDKKSFGAKTRADILMRFIRGKLSPVIGSSYNLLAGTDYIGQPYSYKNIPGEFVPLPFSDVKSAYDSGGLTQALKVLVPSQFGISVSTYSDLKKPKEVEAKPEISLESGIKYKLTEPQLAERKAYNDAFLAKNGERLKKVYTERAMNDPELKMEIDTKVRKYKEVGQTADYIKAHKKEIIDNYVTKRLSSAANKYSKSQMLKKYRTGRGQYNLEKSDE